MSLPSRPHPNHLLITFSLSAHFNDANVTLKKKAAPPLLPIYPSTQVHENGWLGDLEMISGSSTRRNSGMS